ncbi:hypothetical protein TNCV_1921121 [Trichonephila clavipes]|nr:hypothetical protein TNCV_1921121 [Trichonephila clavipes]
MFVIVLGFMLQLYFYPTCKVSRILLLINLLKAAVFFVMFINFYSAAYKGKDARKDSPKSESDKIRKGNAKQQKGLPGQRAKTQ